MVAPAETAEMGAAPAPALAPSPNYRQVNLTVQLNGAGGLNSSGAAALQSVLANLTGQGKHDSPLVEDLHFKAGRTKAYSVQDLLSIGQYNVEILLYASWALPISCATGFS